LIDAVGIAVVTLGAFDRHGQVHTEIHEILDAGDLRSAALKRRDEVGENIESGGAEKKSSPDSVRASQTATIRIAAGSTPAGR
jgi:hypothetical protein